MILLAVDIGGTFTDLMAFDESTGQYFQAKSLTTPDDLVQGIADCIAKSGIDIAKVSHLIHGSTIAINTLIERKGARTALVVTRGTRDVYMIGRGNRPESYNLFFHRPRPLVPRHLTFEADERLLATGEVRTPLDAGQVRELASTLKRQGAEAVAVCFLHSYGNAEHERMAGDILQRELGNVYISLSHRILREYREYERTATTVANAYVGPRVGGYISALESRLQSLGFNGDLAIMQSNGGVMAPAVAKDRPSAMMESGPVGGIIAAAQVGKLLGFENIISFDMGGTTTKASLIRHGEVAMAEGYYVGGYANGHPVMLPVVDVVEVGAGGGSIAWVDEVGALKVGPRSSGAKPGPICYARGGVEPTITDANVVLGRVGINDFLGGEMTLDNTAAIQGIAEHLAKPLHMDIVEAAHAVISISIAKMSLAVREVSVEKGYDPRDFALVASGGAGPLHAVAIARELNIPTVIIPRFPAHFSAMGMLMADERHDFIRTCYTGLAEADFADLTSVYDAMSEEAGILLSAGQESSHQLFLDLRYAGQEFTITVPVELEQLLRADRAGIRASFDQLHQQRYAHHSTEEPVEIINMRLTALGARPKFTLSGFAAQNTGVSPPSREVFLDDPATPVSCPVYHREHLRAGSSISGPAIVHEHASTTVLCGRDLCSVADSGELIIKVGSAS